MALIAIVAVAAVVAVVVVLGLQSTNAKATPATPIPAALLSHITSVPLGDMVAASAKEGSSLNPVGPLTGAPLTDGNKPEILFIGAEFCPHCAAERWAITAALSQFGTFSNLHQIRSAVRDGDIATLTFYGASYSSPYFTFVPVENYTNVPDSKNGFYYPLQNPTAAESALWKNIEAQFGESEGYPFLDIGGKYALYLPQYSFNDLSGLSFTQIANDVGNNATTPGADIDASAAALTKYICGITKDQPASVCSAAANAIAPIGTPSSAASGESTPAGG